MADNVFMSKNNQPPEEEKPGSFRPDLLSSSPELEMILKANKDMELNPGVVSDQTFESQYPEESPTRIFAEQPATPLRYLSPEEESLGIRVRPVNPGTLTSVPPVFQPQAPSINTPQNTDGQYVNRGFISIEDVLFGEAGRYYQYSEKLDALLKFTQENLVSRGSNIEESLKDPEKKAKLISDIDSIVLRELVAEGGYREDVKQFLIASITNEIVGLGPLEPIWQDASITEVIVNGPDNIYIEKEGKLMRASGTRFRSQEHLFEVCQRIIQSTGGKLDITNPLADGRLADGSRVNAVHQNLANRGPLLTIRRFPQLNRSLVDLVALGALNEEMASLLAWLVSNKASSLVVGGTGTGKALDVDTPIPTPKGFVRMGDLKIGDTVFDEQGKQTLVIGAYDEEIDRPCFKVVFSDGSSIIADAEHLWLTYDKASRSLIKNSYYHTILLPEHSCSHSKSVVDVISEVSSSGLSPQRNPYLASFLKKEAEGMPSIKTTKEIRDTLLEDKNYNHSIPIVAGAVNMKNQTLGIAPRVMGKFLAMPRGSREDFISANQQLSTTMSKNVPLDYQGIPTNYLFSSMAQRHELLMGIESLLGTRTSSGYSKITSNSKKLAEDTSILLASLGYQVQSEVDEALEYETVYTLEYREPHSLSDSHRYIVAIDPVESRPVRCIRVVNESHLFLAGESFIPTHNTTLLNALSAAIPRNERIITIEDTLELRLHPDSHVAAMEARSKDAKKENAVDIKDLVKNALRMRPDRIIVGEVRGAEALNMLEACNTGHEGSMSTIHANGPNEALARLAVMIAQGGEMPSDKVDWLVGSALDIMIQIRRYKDGSRRVSGIYEVPNIYSLAKDEPLRTIPLWEWVQTDQDDESGKVIGEYVKKEDMSPHLAEKLGLAFAPMFTWEEVLALSKVN